MEKLTYKIGEKIGNELGLDKDKKEVIAYGAFAILHTLLSLSLTTILGFFFGVLIETLIISFTIYLLRKYSGGVHASTPLNCAIISVIIAVGLSLIVSKLAIKDNIYIIILLGIASFVWSYYTIYKLCPVDSPNKPIKTFKKKARMRKASIRILHIYLTIVFSTILFYLYTKDIFYLNLSICIYLGILWQSFTLTKECHVFIFKIDGFLNKLFNFIRREIL